MYNSYPDKCKKMWFVCNSIRYLIKKSSTWDDTRWMFLLFRICKYYYQYHRFLWALRRVRTFYNNIFFLRIPYRIVENKTDIRRLINFSTLCYFFLKANISVKCWNTKLIDNINLLLIFDNCTYHSIYKQIWIVYYNVLTV